MIERFTARIGPAPAGELWSGDDAAIVAAGTGRTVFTTDAFIEEVDFDLSYATGVDVGWKALAATASDVAAMGGMPSRAVATLSMPSSCPVTVVDDLLEGMLEACERWQIGLVGGDISEADRMSLAIALLGDAQRPVLRSGAHTGDLVCVTGTLGGAAGGLLALRQGLDGLAGVKRRQLRPVARVDEGLALARAGATAMIDVSDGFIADLDHVLQASGVGCEIRLESIPVDPHLEEVAELVAPLEAALTGGEDFELLATIPEGSFAAAEAAVEALGTPITMVGMITDGAARIGDGPIADWKEKGWQHLRNR